MQHYSPISPPFPLPALLFATMLSSCAPAAPAETPTITSEEPTSPSSEETAPPVQAARLDNSTAGVAQRHFALLQEGNVEGLLEDYAESAFFLTPDGVVKGEESLERHLTTLAKEFSESASLDLGDLRVRDDIAYITWSATTKNRKYVQATNTFVIEHGKIMAQTFAGTVVAEEPTDEGPASEQEPLPEGEPSAVLTRHLQAVDEAEFESLLSDYTIDSLILTQKGKKSGKDGIRGVYEGVFEALSNPKLDFQIERKLVEGEVAYVLWSATRDDKPAGFITETSVIREGKIASQTVTLGLED